MSSQLTLTLRIFSQKRNIRGSSFKLAGLPSLPYKTNRSTPDQVIQNVIEVQSTFIASYVNFSLKLKKRPAHKKIRINFKMHGYSVICGKFEGKTHD